MRFGRHTRSERLLSVEITPMVDVVFLLIIFFMTAARFAQETRAQLDLPREAGEQQERGEEAGLVINIERDGTIIVGRRKLPLERLDQVVRGQMRRHGQDASQFRLTIRADRNLDSVRLNQVVTLLQRLGVGAARVATEVPSGP